MPVSHKRCGCVVVVVAASWLVAVLASVIIGVQNDESVPPTNFTGSTLLLHLSSALPEALQNLSNTVNTVTANTPFEPQSLPASPALSPPDPPEEGGRAKVDVGAKTNVTSKLASGLGSVTTSLAHFATGVDAGANCKTVGTEHSCYSHIVWAFEFGLESDPGGYPGMTKDKTFEDWQSFFKAKQSFGSAIVGKDCSGTLPDPCPAEVRQKETKTTADSDTAGFKQGDRPLWPELFAGVHMVPTEKRVIVMCLSRRSAFSVRSAVRETWAKGQDSVFFAVGAVCPVPPKDRPKKPFGACIREFKTTPERQEAWDNEMAVEERKLVQEQHDHGDLARMPGIDSYAGLPQKLKFSYEWALQHCPECQWFVKADDDTIARVPQLESHLSKFDASVPTVIGGIVAGGGVHRTGKWAENNYKPKHYPKFPIGSHGHIVSRPVAQYIADRAKDLFDYQGEDVSVGIWLDESPHKGRVKWVAPPESKTANSGNCADTSKFLIGHDISESKMRRCFPTGG